MFLEIIFGIFGILGIGHVYTCRVLMGIAMMVGWWIYISAAVAITSLTVGIAGCIFGPLYIAVPIISGIQARTYMRKRGGTGNWLPVGLVAGGGCVFTIIAIVIFVFALGFYSRL